VSTPSVPTASRLSVCRSLGLRGVPIPRTSRRVLGLLKRFECKWRGDGFKEIYDWLEGNDGVVIRADRKPALMVIPL
jgi:hypothetical protein